MRVIKRDQLIDATDILLFDILEELKKLAEKELPQQVVQVGVPSPVINTLCPLCGKDHSNTGYALNCAKKQRRAN